MKITDLAILFIIIILPFNLILGYNTSNAQNALYKKIELNRIFETAVEDSTSVLIEGGGAAIFEGGGRKKVPINKEKAAEVFLNTLTINFGLFNDETTRRKLECYIPCLVVVDYDGYYILSNQEYEDEDGYKMGKLLWNPKRLFTYSDYKYIYYFTLDKFISVFDIYEGKYYQGTYDDVSAQIDDEDSEILKDGAKFDEIRRNTIINCLQSDIQYTINKHNNIARKYGIVYNFSLPAISKDDWNRTIDDVGVIAFFQGMPIGVTNETVNNFAIGGAKIVKTQKYYVETDPSSGLKYYHRENCTKRMELTDPILYNNRKDCAKAGCFPCKECNP